MGPRAFPDCPLTGMGTGGAAVRDCSLALPSTCVGTLHARCEVINRRSRVDMWRLWGHRPPRFWCRFRPTEPRRLVVGVEKAAEVDGRQVLQLRFPLLWIRLDPLAWATVAQQLEREGRLLSYEAPSVRNYDK